MCGKIRVSHITGSDTHARKAAEGTDGAVCAAPLPSVPGRTREGQTADAARTRNARVHVMTGA